MRRRSFRGFTLIELVVVIVVIAILAAIILPLVDDSADDSAGGASAQSPRDTTAVLLAAWDSFVGEAPFAHPAGQTFRACLTSGRLLSDAVLRDFDGILRRERSVVRVDGCALDSARTFGGWIRDDQGEPAIVVQLTRLQFDGSERVTLGLHVLAGGLWGRGGQCHLERDEATDAWAVEACQVTEVN